MKDDYIPRSSEGPYEGLESSNVPKELPVKLKQEKQQFHGTNIILCNGRIVMGSDWPFLILTTLLFLVPLILFYVFTLPYLIISFGKWVLILFILLPIMVFSFAFKASMSDPGIIPRYSAPRDRIILINNEQTREILVFHELNPNHLLAKEIIHIQKEMPEGQWPSISLKYCNTCQIFRPLHTSHCSRCDNCVEGFDHHCIWLANCIGKRNYRSFLFFASSLLFTSLITSLFAVLFLFSSWQASPVANRVIAIIILVYTLFFDILGSMLVFYHIIIIARGLTTAEHIKMINSTEQSASNATSKCTDNLASAFCGPKPKKNIDWRKFETRKRLL